MYLADLLFEDNPWWLGNFEGKGWFPRIKKGGILRIWAPYGRLGREDIMWFCQNWANENGEFSIFFFDLSRLEVIPDMLEEALRFYYTRISFMEGKKLMVINSAHLIKDVEFIKDYIDEDTTVILIYPILVGDVDLRILRFNREEFGEISEVFWDGDLEGFVLSLRKISARVERAFWKYLVNFPQIWRFSKAIYDSINSINEFYDIREKEFLRKFLNFVITNHSKPFVYRDLAEGMDVRFETIKSFMEHFFSGGISFEISEIGSSPRSHRRIYLFSGGSYASLTHMDKRRILSMSQEELVSFFSIPELVSSAIERGFSVSFKDESAKVLILSKGERTISVNPYELPYYFVCAI
jgi:hypothetical protein